MLNSYGHPVPVIGGALQPAGGRWRAKILSTAFDDARDRIVLDLGGAYSNLVSESDSLVRTVDFTRGDRPSVSISDVADFGVPRTFESAFLTCGDIERLPDGKSVRITRSGVTVTGRIDVRGEGAWHFEEKSVPHNEDRPLKRLAVVFDRPIARASVTWSFATGG